MPRKNFFIFTTFKKHFNIDLKHCIYGADVSRSEQRGIANAKRGDLALIWVYEDKTLYGIFEIEDRMFFDEIDLGWKGKWHYRFPFKLWDGCLHWIPDKSKPKLMSFISNSMITINDTSDFNTRYINTLLYEEGSQMLKFFLETSIKRNPKSFNPEFASKRIRKKHINFRDRLTLAKTREYVLESYLLQHLEQLEELVGSDITELYNQIFVYAKRFMDIMAIHRDANGNILKATVLELKTNSNRASIAKALDELSHYVYWVRDKVVHSKENVFGILLSPVSKSSNIDFFREESAKLFGMESNKISWIQYGVEETALSFDILA